MTVPLRLIPRNLFASPLVALRSLLTLASLVVAVFLLCILRSVVANLDAGVQASSGRRLVVQSAVSLFVDLPLSYQAKIESVPGVAETTVFQWFGGYYQERSNFFAQFAIDHEPFLSMYPEVSLVQGSAEDWLRGRTACLIGVDLARRFGWQVGDTIPITGGIFPRAGDAPWEFRVAAIYRSSSANVDNHTLFFHFDYLRESLESGEARGPRGAGTYVVQLAPGADPIAVAREIDALFAGGPQRVQTSSEAEFQRQFVSMVGSVPTFLGSIGGGVLFAIVLAVLNTMLMAARERTVDLGILKALGFTDATVFALLLLESLLLAGVGGVLGVGLALLCEPVFGAVLGPMFGGFSIPRSTLLLGLGLAVGVGLAAGLLPAWRASRLRCVEALRAEA
ncbi:MAG: FtsX-like permease family protein [Planctomycetota bacterium]|nr:MAG: FtsX-like permease family protein [Planctomycetota bacterium]